MRFRHSCRHQLFYQFWVNGRINLACQHLLFLCHTLLICHDIVEMFLPPGNKGCKGQYQVDGEVFPVSEGTIIRVAPDGKRALKNTGSENLTMLCIQYKANAFTEADSPMTDGVILQEELKW